MRDRDATILAAVFQPLFVAPVWGEQVAVTFNGEPSFGEDLRELLF